METIVSAPGKLILTGEHAVVYGKPGIIASLERRIRVSIKSGRNKVKQGISGKPKRKPFPRQSQLIRIFNNRYKTDLPSNLQIEIESELPSGAGMGSSASLSAAFFAVLLRSYKKIWNPALINELAYEGEKLFHGSPSGADNSIAVYGGIIWYRKETDFLKVIFSLSEKVYKLPAVLIANTGKPWESTKVMVQKVAQLNKDRPGYLNRIFIEGEENTRKMLIYLKEGNAGGFSDCVYKAEYHLEKIGVVSIKAQEIIRALNKNSIAAKVSGAGGVRKGSGMMFIVSDDKEKVDGVLKKFGIYSNPAVLGGDGIKLEKNVSQNRE